MRPRTPARAQPALICCGLLLLALFGARDAAARGGDGGAILVGKLLEAGFQKLRLAETAYFKGDSAQAARHGKAAERLFLDVLDQEPRNLVAAMLGGQASVLAGDLTSATEWEQRYRRFTRRGEADPDLHYLHAFIHLLGTKRPTRALRSLRRMYSLDPGARPQERDNLWFKALNDYGRLLLEGEKYEDAITQFKSGARIARRQGNREREKLMKSNVGVSLMRADRFIEAARVYEGLIKADPMNPVWHWQYGLCLADQSKFIDAVPVYREVIRLMGIVGVPTGMGSDLRQVHLRLGNCLRHVAQRLRGPEQQDKAFVEAEAEIRLYIKQVPEDTAGHKWLGVLLFKDLDKRYEALPHLGKAFKLDEICVDALKYMLQIHMHHPPPPEQLPEDDPKTAARNRAAWTAVIEVWTKNIEEGVERRQKVIGERKRMGGKTGCV